MEVCESGEQPPLLHWDRKLSELCEPADPDTLLGHTVRRAGAARGGGFRPGWRALRLLRGIPNSDTRVGAALRASTASLDFLAQIPLGVCRCRDVHPTSLIRCPSECQKPGCCCFGALHTRRAPGGCTPGAG